MLSISARFDPGCVPSEKPVARRGEKADAVLLLLLAIALVQRVLELGAQFCLEAEPLPLSTKNDVLTPNLHQERATG